MSPDDLDDLDAIELPTVGFLREIPQELHPTTLAVLKAAKAQLWDGQVWDLDNPTTPYVCIAISKAAKLMRRELGIAKYGTAEWGLYRSIGLVEHELRERIYARLQVDNAGRALFLGYDNVILHGWVDAVRGQDTHLNPRGWQILRHKWLDSLIEELSN